MGKTAQFNKRHKTRMDNKNKITPNINLAARHAQLKAKSQEKSTPKPRVISALDRLSAHARNFAAAAAVKVTPAK